MLAISTKNKHFKKMKSNSSGPKDNGETLNLDNHPDLLSEYDSLFSCIESAGLSFSTKKNPKRPDSIETASSRSSAPASRASPTSSTLSNFSATVVEGAGLVSNQSNQSVDAEDQTEDEEGHRVVVRMANGAPMSKQMEEEFKAALESEMRAMMIRERSNRNLVRMRVETWTPRRGGYVLTPGGANPTLNGHRIIQMAHCIRVSGQCVVASWNYELPQHATLMARFNGTGDARELIEDAFLGLVATNEWPEGLQGQVRFVKVQKEENPSSTFRLIRFEATEAVVKRIQAAGGTIYLGFGKATVENNKNPVKKGSTVVYRLQK